MTIFKVMPAATKVLLVLAILALVFATVACDGDDSATPAATPPPSSKRCDFTCWLQNALDSNGDGSIADEALDAATAASENMNE